MPKKIKIIILGLIALVVASGVFAGIMYKRVQSLTNPAGISEDQVEETVADVRKVLLLPADETPTLATVADPSKLKDQIFFANAETGDIVLIYANSKKAILWRPSTKQVIEVSSLNITSPNSGTATESTP